MAYGRAYRSFDDFHRDEIRPSMRVGFSVDELDDHQMRETIDFDVDPIEAMWDLPVEDDDE